MAKRIQWGEEFKLGMVLRKGAAYATGKEKYFERKDTENTKLKNGQDGPKMDNWCVGW